MLQAGASNPRGATPVAVCLVAVFLAGCLATPDANDAAPEDPQGTDVQEPVADEPPGANGDSDATDAANVDGDAGNDSGADADNDPPAPPPGTASVDLHEAKGMALRLSGPGWVRVDLTSDTEATFDLHVTRPSESGPVSALETDATRVAPNDYLWVAAFGAQPSGDMAPLFDLLIWGFAEDLRNRTEPGQGLMALANPGHLALGPETRGAVVVATSMAGVTVSLTPHETDTADDATDVTPIRHGDLVARYAAEGTESMTVAAAGLLMIDERVDFPGETPQTPGLDAVIVWQSGEGTARYGSMDVEMGQSDAEGACRSAGGGGNDLYYDAEDPTGSAPALNIGASKVFVSDPGARTLCAAALATMVGGWERTGAGAWFFHGPFEAPDV